MKISIQNGTLVLDDRLKQADILIDGERIAAIAPRGTLPPADLTVDAASSLVFPGFIDLHTHLDDVIGGRYLADTWHSGSQIAVQNGSPPSAPSSHKGAMNRWALPSRGLKKRRLARAFAITPGT